MKNTKKILLLDHSGANHSDIQILLRVAGHKVQYFDDDLIAVNRYCMDKKTEHAFDLVIFIDGDKKAEFALEQLTESFGRLLLIEPAKTRISLCTCEGLFLLGHHLEDLLEIVTAESLSVNERSPATFNGKSSAVKRTTAERRKSR